MNSEEPEETEDCCAKCKALRVHDSKREELTCYKLNIYVTDDFYCKDFEAAQ